jgi:hypothetical protein
MKMGACVLCEEQITTPLGPQRLGEQIATWINETNPTLADEFTNVSNELLESKQYGDDVCIINKCPMRVCAYCYTEHIFSWLLSTKPSWETIREFLIYFDYDTSKFGIEVRAKGKLSI